MSDNPFHKPKPDDDGKETDLDLLQRLPASSPFARHPSNPATPEDEPIEEFWAVFSMITHTGDRFSLSVCFRNRQHFNLQMKKFETAKNMHIVLKDINDESVVIKRDMLLHVLPEDHDTPATDNRPW
jgi:hypothetical protein